MAPAPTSCSCAPGLSTRREIAAASARRRAPHRASGAADAEDEGAAEADILVIGEADPLEPGAQLAGLEAADPGGARGDPAEQRRGRREGGADVEAAGAEHAADLAEDELGVVVGVERAGVVDAAEGAVGEGQGV